MTLGDNLLRFNKEQKYICFDKETESLNKFYARPYQISFVVFTQSEILEQHDHYLYWADLNVSKGAAEKTRFNPFLYKEKAVDPKPILEKFESYTNDPQYLIVGHNILGYDSMIHQVWRRYLGLPPDDYSRTLRYIDTGALAKAYQKQLKPDRTNFLAWQYRMLSMREGVKWRLGLMTKEFKVPYEEERLHEALYDVLLNVEVFKKMIWAFEI